MKPTATTTLDARNTNRKYEVFNRRSGEVTGNLRKLDGGTSLYEAAQGAERALRTAKHEWDVHAARLGEANEKLEQARKQLIHGLDLLIDHVDALLQRRNLGRELRGVVAEVVRVPLDPTLGSLRSVNGVRDWLAATQ
jgi:hypothetical protein